jgi:hypothetical protein
MQENNYPNIPESENKFDWKYLIPTYGLYFVYKSPFKKKGKWWAMSLFSTFIALKIFISILDSAPEKISSEVKNDKPPAPVIIDLAEKIKILACNCNVEKVLVRKGEYVAGVQIVAPKHEDSLKCKATFLNQNEKKIDTGFEVSWEVQTKTGAIVAKVSESVDEFLPPNLKVNWDITKSYSFQQDEIADIKKRKAKVECSLAKLKEVD